MGTSKRLTKDYASAKIIPYDAKKRYVIMSDCHRGVGNWGDNFLSNQNLFFAALNHYYKNGYIYIENGDGDELWENRNMKQIVQTHSDAFWLMSKFYQEKRLYMIYGNHDQVKRTAKFIQKNMSTYVCDSNKSICSLFPNMQAYEGIIMEDEKTGQTIFITHGHQGDQICDRFWRLGRFLVRYVWRRLELLGFKDPTSAATSFNKKNILEYRIARWSRDNNQMIITGHTHRAIFPTPGESLFFNDGCCVHPRCVTAIEINEGKIVLVKWSVLTKDDGTMYVGRTELEGPVALNDYWIKYWQIKTLYSSDRI